MANKDEKIHLINSYMVTVRRIHEIEQKALKKIGAHRTDADGPACSFCGKGEDQPGRLVEGSRSARICVSYLAKINEMLSED